MLGEKGRKIEELQGQVADLEQEIAEIQPWVGLAREIKVATHQFAAGIDLETAATLAVQQVGEEQRHAFIEAAFMQLDPERQLTILSDAFGDGILKEALEKERQKRLQEDEADAKLKKILEVAATDKKILFTELPADLKIEVFLYLSSEHSTGISDDFNNWSRRISGVTTAAGTISVHEDIVRDRVYDSQAYKHRDHLELEVRNPINASNNVYYGVGAHIPAPEKRGGRYMNADLGPVFINGTEIFGVLPDDFEIKRS